MTALTRLARRLREDRGVESLEIIVAIGVWWVSAMIFVNMFLLLGTAMTVNSALNRTAQHAAAMGCLDDSAITDFTAETNKRAKYGLGASGFKIEARTPTAMPNDYAFDRSSVIVNEGQPTESVRGEAAVCTDTMKDAATRSTVVANGGYIWLRVSYDQNLMPIPGVHAKVRMRRSVLVVSQSLRGDPAGS